MIATPPRTTLGTLRTEQAVLDDIEGLGHSRTMYRPEHTPLLNDGRWHHWMLPGEDYDLDHDGRGWVVTCRTWMASAPGHTYRLATEDFAMATALPVDDGAVELDPATRYRLRTAGQYEWVLEALER
jgi:hypothetical protein